MLEDRAEELRNKISSDKIEKIADHYGLQHQLYKSVEELIELVQAIQDYSFKLGMRDDEISTEHVADEIADVKIMIAQLEYLLELEEEVNDRVEFKLNRQIDRIKLEKESVQHEM